MAVKMTKRAGVKIKKRAGDRGFHQYGTPLVCTYGTKLTVYESSSAMGPHVWLRLEQGYKYKGEPGTLSISEACAHLNAQQARSMVARLQAWLDEIPTRWRR